MKTCPLCGNTFDPEVRFCPHDGAALRSPAAPEAVEGGLVSGRYEIIRELGRGGMGVVYQARHIQMDRLCALKMVRADSLVNPDAVARFHREARNASRISHPNVVAVYDFGETAEGNTYLAMEYVEGRTLDALLAETGPLPPRRAARIAWQIANGLNVAHELKIVHRDLKPANIMLTRYRAWEDFVKVVDFGIAKAFGVATGSTLTSTGLAVGTPGYMSPEQWTGPETDHRSDIYSLAMICVHMLAGAPPANRPAVPLGGSLVLDSNPATATWPDYLRAVLVKGLAPVPEERYPTVTEFATALVTAVTRWTPTDGVREPWEERLSAAASADARGGAFPSESIRRGRLGKGRVAAIVVGGAALVGVLIWGVVSSGIGTVGAGSPAPADSRGTGLDTSASAPAARIERPLPPARGPTRGVVAVWSDSAAALASIFDLDRPVADSAQRVVALAGGLLRRELPDSARITVAYHLAEAQLFLGADSAACGVLREIQPASERSGYFSRSVRLLLSRHCG